MNGTPTTFLDTPRQRMGRRLGSLRTEFSSWQQHLRELAEHMNPRRARWNRTDFNRGDKINGTIINNTPLLANRIFASGFMAAVSNPLIEWFRLTPPDPDMAEWGPVKRYLHVVQERLRWAFAMGSFYRGLADGMYPDLGTFGFSCGLLEEDPKRILRLTVLPIGEYYLSANANGEVDTIYRELPMTVRQLVGEFCIREGNAQLPLDFSRVSSGVRSAWEQGAYDTVVDVVHVIQPNDELEPGRLGPRGMPFASRWFESKANEEKFLRDGGFEEFPGLCPRWSVRGGETYGRSEGMNVLGDCKQLQHHERRLALLIDLAARPPMVADEQMRGQRLSLVSGDTVYVPRGQTEGFRPAMQVNPAAITALLEHIQRAEKRIEQGMFADLFARILRDDRAERATATEIEQLAREVASQVGPGLERVNAELFVPAIARGYATLERRGFLPPPPRELQGQDIKPEFISPMHQAQKGVEIQPIRVFLGEVATLAGMRPDALDKLNVDEIVDELSNATGIKPDLVLSDDEVAKLRQERAKREQALQAGQAALAAAKGAKDLGTTPAPAPDNALGAVLSKLSPAVVQSLSPGEAAGAANAPLGPIAGGGAFTQPGGIA